MYIYNLIYVRSPNRCSQESSEVIGRTAVGHPQEDRECFFPQTVQIRSGAQPASYPLCTGCLCLRHEVLAYAPFSVCKNNCTPTCIVTEATSGVK